MRFPFKQLFRDLSGRSDQVFVDLISGQIEATLEGASLVRELVTSGDASFTARSRELMREIEHQGDNQRALLVAELSRALITPIDREDLFRLSRAIDDVLDNLRDFFREWDLYGVESKGTFGPLLEAVIEGMTELRGAVSVLVTRPSAVPQGALASKKAGGKIRRLYQLETARLFERELSMDVLKRRELLRRLDVVGLRLGEAADYLADASVKRSH
ncbi:MAG: DUF47 family protein [Actinomycetota bacterium]|nr:DUF47 family protein [Actinomycetota bacterium]MDP9474568.1 DUF47 family protein [Actinomycetota bacterium]